MAVTGDLSLNIVKSCERQLVLNQYDMGIIDLHIAKKYEQTTI